VIGGQRWKRRSLNAMFIPVCLLNATKASAVRQLLHTKSTVFGKVCCDQAVFAVPSRDKNISALTGIAMLGNNGAS